MTDREFRQLVHRFIQAQKLYDRSHANAHNEQRRQLMQEVMVALYANAEDILPAMIRAKGG